MSGKSPFPIPPWILALDGVGTVLVVLGMLAALGIDLGLPALAGLWPLLIILGAGLMAPMVVWAVRRAQRARDERP
ncbi:hypothetical protein [Elongatibacter sediminis]|uniref:DUF5668 domain-containing protein n=1 Tax=Elongatibacter sediminis TaxID=3119006 RepID=A0AAW9RAW3_9GAMM